MRLQQVPQLIAPMATLAFLVTMWPCTAYSATREQAAKAPRYAVEAQLITLPPSLGGSRFQLQADLLPQRSSPKLESAGFLLKASLAPAGEPVCAAPGFIFGSSFESP